MTVYLMVIVCFLFTQTGKDALTDSVHIGHSHCFWRPLKLRERLTISADDWLRAACVHTLLLLSSLLFFLQEKKNEATIKLTKMSVF